MEKNKLGKTDIEVSKISFGTVALGLPYGIGVIDQSDMLAEDDAIALLRSALEKGVNFYDTALAYGRSEQLIGKAFADCRNKVVICSKSAHLYDPYVGQSLPPPAQIRQKLEDSFKQSLVTLQTDYIDVYMSHIGTEEVIENDTVIDFYQQLKKKGYIRATGISVYTLQETIKAVETGVWDVIQLAFNLLEQTQLPAIELACDKGVGIVVRSVLFKGILTERGNNLHPALKPVWEHRQKYFAFLNDSVKSLSDLAIRFVLSVKGVSSILIGIDKPVYLESAMQTFSQGLLDDKIVEKLKTLAYPEPEFLNLPKWDRMGWLK